MNYKDVKFVCCLIKSVSGDESIIHSMKYFTHYLNVRNVYNWVMMLFIYYCSV